MDCLLRLFLEPPLAPCQAYGAWNKKEAFSPPVCSSTCVFQCGVIRRSQRYEKSAEQKERIEKCLERNFLFHALDKKAQWCQ